MIRIRLDYLLLDKQMKLKDLQKKTGLALNNLSILKINKVRAIRFTTLNAICKAMGRSPGEIIEFVPDEGKMICRNLSEYIVKLDKQVVPQGDLLGILGVMGR